MQISSSAGPSSLGQGHMLRRLSLHKSVVLFLLVTTYVFFLSSLSPVPSSASGLFGQEGDDDGEDSPENKVNGGSNRGEPLDGETPLDPEEFSDEEKPEGAGEGGWLDVLNSFMKKEGAFPAAPGASVADFVGKRGEIAAVSFKGSSGKANVASIGNKTGEGRGAANNAKRAYTSNNAANGGREGGNTQSPLFARLASLLNMNFGEDVSEEEEEPEEESEEDLMAESIIHGTKKKVVPRIRTAVDDLVDLIEEEKLRQIAKNERQLRVLLERKRAKDESAQSKEVDAPPEFFLKLAQQAADFHRRRDIERRKREAVMNLTQAQLRLRKRANRREQKEKLIAWRESQIHQVEMDSKERQKLLNQTRREGRELERTLDEDLPGDLDDWGFNSETEDDEQ
ncbi:transmembrane protein [Cystoisospora suis]|uniref:Transmembrane protein n=1 Tax=Cystoisospora suis TaxID=483139 RepID=A0A2C6L9X6_9APIC|nr:transmembrane protein [Cystoisospora suis]